MKTDCAVFVDTRRFSVVQIGIAMLIPIVLFFSIASASASFAASDEPSEERKTEKYFDKATKKFSPPWYSSKDDAVVFLPQKKERKSEPEPVRNNDNVKPSKPMNPGVASKVLSVWLPIATLVVLLAILGWLAARALRERAARRRFKEGELLKRKRRIETLAVEARERYDDLETAAEEALGRGDLRSALIFFFSWILVEMDKRDAVVLDKGKTNLEYWRELEGRPRLRDIYHNVMKRFERVYFGGFSISRQEFDKVWNLRGPFSEIMREEDERKRRLEQEREEAFRRAAERNWRGPKTMSILLLALAFFLVVSGCSNRNWEDRYARAGANPPSPKSLNGFDVFYKYCQYQNRGRVRTLDRWSEDFDDCDVIVWFCSGDDYGGTAGTWIMTSPVEPRSAFGSDKIVVNDVNRRDSVEEETFRRGAARSKAWLAMIDKYATATEDDWTNFFIPWSNRLFHHATYDPFEFDSFPYGRAREVDLPSQDEIRKKKSSRDRVCEWLEAKPGRKCVVVLTDYNSVWDYWRASRREVERIYDDPLKSEYLKECDKRLDGMTDRPFFASSPYRKTPQDFAKEAREKMKLRSEEADKIKLLLSKLGETSNEGETVERVLELREKRNKERWRKSIAGGNDEEENDDEENGEIVFDDDFTIDGVSQPLTEFGQIFFSRGDFESFGVDFGDFWESGVAEDEPELWFRQYYVETSSLTEPESARFSGESSWTSQLPETAPLRERVKLVPSEGTETLLALGDFPLVCRRKVGDSEAILTNSTSFLSNYGLIDPTNRVIASRLEREFPQEAEIGFLVSDSFYRVPRATRTSRYRHEKPEGRFTLTQASPFTIFVWHAFVLAIIAGFCAWPIFGRARRVARDETSDFGLHVDATARLLRNADSVSWTREQIDACRKFRKRERPWGSSQSSESDDENNSTPSKSE